MIQTTKPRSEWQKKRNPLVKWNDGEHTRGNAINATCWLCMGGTEKVGVVDDIRQCTSTPDCSTPCPLWMYRPYK